MTAKEYTEEENTPDPVAILSNALAIHSKRSPLPPFVMRRERTALPGVYDSRHRVDVSPESVRRTRAAGISCPVHAKSDETQPVSFSSLVDAIGDRTEAHAEVACENQNKDSGDVEDNADGKVLSLESTLTISTRNGANIVIKSNELFGVPAAVETDPGVPHSIKEAHRPTSEIDTDEKNIIVLYDVFTPPESSDSEEIMQGLLQSLELDYVHPSRPRSGAWVSAGELLASAQDVAKTYVPIEAVLQVPLFTPVRSRNLKLSNLLARHIEHENRLRDITEPSISERLETFAGEKCVLEAKVEDLTAQLEALTLENRTLRDQNMQMVYYLDQAFQNVAYKGSLLQVAGADMGFEQDPDTNDDTVEQSEILPRSLTPI